MSYRRALASGQSISTKRALGSSSKDTAGIQLPREKGSTSFHSPKPLGAMASSERGREWGAKHEVICSGDANLGLRLIIEEHLSELLLCVVS